MASIKAWLRLFRTGNCVIIGLASATGYFLGGGRDPVIALLVGLASALVAAGGNSINDYFDHAIDLVNKPWRPLPSGQISPRTALIVSLVSTGLGVVVGYLISPLCGLIASIAALVLYAYSSELKKSGFWGNVIIASLSALSVLYGGLAAPRPELSFFPAGYAFLIILGREILKGLEDYEGDKFAGVNTVAATRGPRTAVLAGSAILLSVVFMSPIPLLLGYDVMYGVFALLGVDLPIIASIAYVWRDPLERGWRATRLLKIPLLSGLLAFLVGTLG